LPGTNTSLLLSGGDDDYTAIARETERIVVSEEIRDVEKIARVCAGQFIALRLRRAESSILAPLLTGDTFIARQNELRPELAARYADELKRFELGVNIIVAGVDDVPPFGVQPHLYTICDPGEERCQDGVGYAATGEGAWLAETILMKVRYDANTPVNEAVIIVYWAKKEADRASTVGPDTDITIMHPQGLTIRPNIAQELDKQWKRHMGSADRAFNNSMKKLYQFGTTIITPSNP
jgi:hypothetical protein